MVHNKQHRDNLKGLADQTKNEDGEGHFPKDKTAYILPLFTLL